VGAKGSMYEFYRELIALRKDSEVLADGTVRFLDTGSGAPKVIAFERVLGSERMVAICSFDSEGCTVDADSLGIDVLLSTHGGVGKLADGALALRPYEALLIAC
jgi:glycosidase